MSNNMKTALFIFGIGFLVTFLNNPYGNIFVNIVITVITLSFWLGVIYIVNKIHTLITGKK